MKEVLIRQGNKQWPLHIPSTFEELNAKQLLELLAPEQDPRRLWRTFGVKMSLILQMDSYQRITMSHLFDFLTDTSVTATRFVVDRFGSLRAPQPMLVDMCFQQFMTIDQLFSYYIVQPSDELLAGMCAACYVKKGEGYVIGGDVKELVPIDDRTRMFQKKKFAALRAATLLNWILIKNWLSKMFPHLFPKSEGEDEQQGHKRPADWLALFDAFMGENVHHMQEYQNMPCMDAFRIINRKIENQNKQALQ